MRWRRPVPAGIAALWLPFACLAQDAVAVGDRGIPGPRVSTIVGSPFKIVTAPLPATPGVVRWLAARLAAVRRIHRVLGEHGIHPDAGAQGPNSGFGPLLRLGRGPDTSRGFAFVQGGWTYRTYWHAEARAGLRGVQTFLRLEERPRDVFFGIGNGTREADWSDYKLRRLAVGMRASRQVARRLRVTATLEWTDVTTGAGTDDSRPNIDSLFSATERPGFGESHHALSLSAGIDWKAGPRHTAERSGSRLAAQYRWNESRTGGVANSGVLRVAAAVEVPFHRRRRSIALATSLETLRPASTGVVPFYALPTLGGPNALPSFRTERFRGPDAVVGEIEYRQRVWSDRADRLWIDAVLFTTGGVVATRLLDALSSARLHQSTGIAAALITRQATVARFGVSWGADGVGITVSTSREF